MQKLRSQKWIIIFLAVFGVMLLSLPSSAHAEEVGRDKEDSKEKMIYEYEKAVNSHDTEQYMSLFADRIKKEMRCYIDRCGNDCFFLEKNIDIVSVERDKNYEDAELLAEYEDVDAYSVLLSIDFKTDVKRDTCRLLPGLNDCIFVFVKESGEWKLFCVSCQNDNEAGTRTLSCPSETVIYFTKTDNMAHWNATSKNLMWNDYLKNVLPKEWIISYYSYSAYSYATSLASKMYAWYNTVNPKWYFSPYYSCMKDNSDDQNYLYSAYGSLASYYRTYVDNALSNISHMAMVTSTTESIFEVHYNATSGGYHSGTMSASGCLSKAQNGDTYTDILSYYYSNSPYSGDSITIAYH